jgi:hypothetical protein
VVKKGTILFLSTHPLFVTLILEGWSVGMFEYKRSGNSILLAVLPNHGLTVVVNLGWSCPFGGRGY